ncbi:hypothetical protein [Streptomyces sp. Tu 2975]|nr:hypothetical protein [Streptomyces sp. Tu 2975]
MVGQVDGDLRHAAVVALGELGRSDDWAGQLHEMLAGIDPVLRRV